jgi:prepilin signal peptidase PulO-like enzyme (type II secretory pathway)
MLGVVSVGTQVSKPYPFGPALAIGGFIAMFLLPNWLVISPPLH